MLFSLARPTSVVERRKTLLATLSDPPPSVTVFFAVTFDTGCKAAFNCSEKPFKKPGLFVYAL